MASLWLLRLLAQDGLAASPQHGILDLVRGSGPVVQFILYLLILFSVASWGIIVYKFRQLRRAKRESEKFIDVFWERRNLSSIHEASRTSKRVLWRKYFGPDMRNWSGYRAAKRKILPARP